MLTLFLLFVEAFKLSINTIRLCINFFILFHLYIFSALLYISKYLIDASLYRMYVQSFHKATAQGRAGQARGLGSLRFPGRFPERRIPPTPVSPQPCGGSEPRPGGEGARDPGAEPGPCGPGLTAALRPQNDISEREQRWGAKTIEGSGRAGHIE